jgi:hypothetical protein
MVCKIYCSWRTVSILEINHAFHVMMPSLSGQILKVFLKITDGSLLLIYLKQTMDTLEDIHKQWILLK